jgi:uncharacterized metal-binding protein YceD (DUF177 family)
MTTEKVFPFPYPLAVDKIPARGLRLRIEAGPEECRAVAEWLDVLQVFEMAAEFQVNPMGKTGMVRVNGRLTARVTQACAVTLAAVEATVDEEISLTFRPAAEDEEEGGDEIEIDFHAADPPDPIIDGAIDLGAVMVEHLALGIDPFPRAEGAHFDPPEDMPEAPEPKANPFAVLASLKQKR